MIQILKKEEIEILYWKFLKYVGRIAENASLEFDDVSDVSEVFKFKLGQNNFFIVVDVTKGEIEKVFESKNGYEKEVTNEYKDKIKSFKEQFEISETDFILVMSKKEIEEKALVCGRGVGFDTDPVISSHSHTLVRFGYLGQLIAWEVILEHKEMTNQYLDILFSMEGSFVYSKVEDHY